MVKISIEDIRITERIRKEIKGIDELAEDIRRNGLINPITVMKTENEGIYRLIAGLRRIKAVQVLGWAEVEVNVVSPADAEDALLIEISENEKREPFTFTEKMDVAKILEEVERIKALERKSIGGKGGLKEDVENVPHLQQGKSRDAVGSKLGMSGRQFDKAKYLVENAPPELLQQLDEGDKSVHKAYNELRNKTVDTGEAQGESTQTPSATVPVSKPAGTFPKTEPTVPKTTSTKSAPDKEQMSPYMKRIMEQDEERLRRNREWDAMSPAEKIAALEKRVEAESGHAIQAENELAKFKEQIHNQIFHRDSIIDNLKMQRDRLISELEAANAKIAELEEKLREAGLA